MIAAQLLPAVLLSSVLVVGGCVGGADTGSQGDGGDNAAQGDLPGVAYASGPLPDLVETTVGAPPTSAVIGQSFSVSDTVTNQGTADAGASYTKYYLSSNGTTPAYFLGYRSVGAITVGNSDSGSATAVVPTGVAQGSYRLLACADSGPGNGANTSQVSESNETNNCTASAGSVAITGPDLTESNVSVSPATLNAATGTLTVSDTVNNIGSASAGASVTRWFLSPDNIRNSNDAYIRNCVNGGAIPGRNVGTITAGGSSAGQASTSPLCIRDSAGLHPPATGTYYVIACADQTNQVGELNESNNCAASSNTVQVTGGVDLTETAVSNPPASGAVGTSFAITDTVQNVGGDPAPSSFTKFYLSTNGTSLNVYLNTRSVSALAANATDTATTTMTILNGTPSGTYHVVACADAGPGTAAPTSQIAETNENNNCRASTGTITLASPDLVIASISNPPTTGSIGDTFPVADVTSNIGNGDAGAFYNKYYLSTNGTLPVYLLAPGAAAAALPAGMSEAVSATATIPAAAAPGTYWLLGCTDVGPGTGAATSQVVESNENNNCTKSQTQITIL